MATKRKKDISPIDLRDKITLYAPKGAPYHKQGQEVLIHPVQKSKFIGMGFTETAPAKADVKK